MVPQAERAGGRPLGLSAHLCCSSAEHRGRHPQTMFLARLTSQLLRVAPRAGKRSRGVRWAGHNRVRSMCLVIRRPGPGHASCPANIQAS